jgi:hypothetical protein
MFLFIIVVDRPFMGNFSVTSTELAELSQKFDSLDRLRASQANSPTPAAP